MEEGPGRAVVSWRRLVSHRCGMWRRLGFDFEIKDEAFPQHNDPYRTIRTRANLSRVRRVLQSPVWAAWAVAYRVRTQDVRSHPQSQRLHGDSGSSTAPAPGPSSPSPLPSRRTAPTSPAIESAAVASRFRRRRVRPSGGGDGAAAPRHGPE